MRKFDFQTVILVAAILLAGVAIGYAVWPAPEPVIAAPRSEGESFDGNRAMQHLREICALGARPSGSVGMQRQQEMLQKYFTDLGAKVNYQSFPHRHPESGQEITLSNMIVQWHPDRKNRILLCAHYDTRPYPDNDPDRRKRKALFVGANDGASGVALLMELGRSIRQVQSDYGVDFVFFDAEELVYDQKRDPYFLGSKYFARHYAANPPAHRYRYGVLLDMVGDKNLNIHPEVNSVTWPDTRQLVIDIWSTAKRLGIREFHPQAKHQIEDDHIPLHDVGGIPTCDIIDFDYPTENRRTSYWHTTNDVPENCSADSLGKVGRVILAWLDEAR